MPELPEWPLSSAVAVRFSEDSGLETDRIIPLSPMTFTHQMVQDFLAGTDLSRVYNVTVNRTIIEKVVRCKM
jgi:hypothetical protein